MDFEGMQVLFAAIVAKHGPFVLNEEDVVDNTLGVKVWLDELTNTMHVKSWDQSESEHQETE